MSDVLLHQDPSATRSETIQSNQPLVSSTGNVALPTPKGVFRGCANQRASHMKICTPWEFKPDIPADVGCDKASFRLWEAKNTTQHLFYSASEGLNADWRVNEKTNPIKALHGLIADYDTPMTASMIDTALAYCSGENQPNWVSRTFSEGARVVWLFQEPLPMDNANLAKAFLKLAAEELRVEKLLPGLDKPAWNKLSQIYEVGRDWRSVSRSPLSTYRLHDMLFRASEKVQWRSEGTAIPVEILIEEIERKWPGTWPGSFDIGARGPVFWDGGSNPASCIVQETGIMCFSRKKVFYTWSDIFGPGFVSKYEANRVGAAVSEAYYDGKCYWIKSDDGVWQPNTKGDFVLHLKVGRGLHTQNNSRENGSEVERVLLFVQKQRRVEGGIPSIYNPADTLTINGRRFVNSSAVRVIQPADVPQKWGEDFPWLADFLDTCWDDALVPCVVEGKPSQLAKDIFLAWFRRAYVTALHGDIQTGHALFIVGKVGSGKTLLSTRIVGGAMGGGSEAADFLLSSSRFNKELANVGVWNIDDGSVNCDPRSHQKFAEMLKRVVANPNLSYQPKYRDQQRVEWNGRVITTLNDDASSLGMIPDVDTGLQNKIIVLKFSDKVRKFPPNTQLEGKIKVELPRFLRWLLDYEVPAELIGESRFGINAYIHEETRVAALHSSLSTVPTFSKWQEG
jgi:hypothetical protein